MKNFFVRIFWKLRKLFSANFIGILSLFLAICFAFYPNLLSIQYGSIDKSRLEIVKKNLSNDAIIFVDDFKNKKIYDPKLFFKSIPPNLPVDQRNLIVDLFRYSIDYSQIHLLFLSIILILFVIAVIFRELKSGKKYAIAHSLVHLHKAIHHLRDDWNKIFVMQETGNLTFNGTVASECLTKSLDEVERYYSIVTGSPCRACIKTVDKKSIVEMDKTNTNLLIETFARSSNSTKAKADTPNDKIENNSKFLHIVTNQVPYCLFQNIDKVRYYDNSHLDRSNKKKKASEQLGYKSTLTFALRTKNEKEIHLWGFLCLDTQTSHVFSERWDIEPGFLLADYYSLFVNKVAMLQQKNTHNNKHNETKES